MARTGRPVAVPRASTVDYHVVVHTDADATGPPSLLLLGPPAVRSGHRLEPMPGRRQTLLFCLLAIEPGSVVETARLTHALWERARPADPGNALQSLVSRLRRPPHCVPVVRASAGYRIEVDPDAVDAVRF